ncbi:RNA polymerase subunit sigma-70 [Shewanella sp. GutCb]|uniref:ECF-type sigma factor n=1 Tax=Shewanella sp. GutCb TaxID=2058315 RepID=UPI000C7E5ADA|nr:ECF-type sigma factor [Shewanella sp. GutCb]PKG73049.1 RNA polymerase subunit sigma-70 [Shewanella sp. GutCb]
MQFLTTAFCIVLLLVINPIRKNSVVIVSNTVDNSDPLAHILTQWNAGNKDAEQQLYQFAYQKFHQLASQVKKNSTGKISESTLLQISCNTTSLVHDAFIKVNKSRDLRPDTTKQLYIIFSNVIYSILIDNIRKSQAIKRKKLLFVTEYKSLDNIQKILDIELILNKLSLTYSRQVSVFIYKYICLMPSKEIADLFLISPSTVDKDLSFIKNQLSNNYND